MIRLSIFVFGKSGGAGVKLLLWEEGGLVLWYKRLEQGTFELPQPAAGRSSVSIKWTELMLIIEGVKLSSVQKRKRYSLEKSR